MPTASLTGVALAVLGGGLTACCDQVAGQASPAGTSAAPSSATASAAVTWRQ